MTGRAAARSLDGFDAEEIEVSTIANLRALKAGQVVRLVESMPPRDVTELRGLPVSTIHRTLIDVGDRATLEEVELAYECARRRHQTNDQRLCRRIEELGTKGRKGPATLAKIMAIHATRSPTDSALEVRFLQLNRRFQLPEPERQWVN